MENTTLAKISTLALASSLVALGSIGPTYGASNVVRGGPTYTNGIVSETNKHRGYAKLTALPRDGQSCETGFADRHAKKLATEKKLYHQDLRPILEKCGFRAVGENIAKVPINQAPKTTVDLWINSPGHRANILNKQYDRIGVATWHNNAEGYKYVVQVFAKK